MTLMGTDTHERLSAATCRPIKRGRRKRIGIMAAVFLACPLPSFPIVRAQASRSNSGPAAIQPGKNCGTWTVQPGLEPLAPNGQLNAMTAISPDDVWAVGDGQAATRAGFPGSGDDLANSSPLAERWNGARWKRYAVPNPEEIDLLAVSGTSAKDVWAVGSLTPEAGFAIEHWDGNRWRVALQNNNDQTLDAVAAISPTDVWAVGGDPYGGRNSTLLMEHWNGKHWRTLNSSQFEGEWLSISASSPHNVWAVGYSSSGSLVRRWNGKTWEHMRPPPGHFAPRAVDVLFAV